MAITNAQQARQLYKEGSKKPVKQAGVTNYLGKQEMVTAPKFWLSEPGHVKAKLSYITDEEAKILIDKNLYGSLKGKPNIGPAGLPSLQGGDSGGLGGDGPSGNDGDKTDVRGPAELGMTTKGPPTSSPKGQDAKLDYLTGKYRTINLNPDQKKDFNKFQKRVGYSVTPSTNPINKVIATALGLVTPFGIGRFAYNKAIDNAAMGYGVTSTEDDDDDTGGDNDNYRETRIAEQFSPVEKDVVEEETFSPIQELLRQRDLAGGARRFAADGGIMGGLADGQIDEMGRQMYGLGKLVKKATRAVKKLVKSDVGKAAIAAYAGYKIGNVPIGETGQSFFQRAGETSLGELIKRAGTNTKNYFMNMDRGDQLSLLASAGLTVAPLLFQEEEEEPDYANNRGASLGIEAIRRDPYKSMGQSYRFYAEGGKAEPVAKETMPLLDMDGKEMDLRADGGFVPIGRMEKADDVPARLSKNEFVFTADAVRNAGEGDIDKGAEVMYNMMKNLESGGEVSEESQGLDGARDMFKTSQRLEEVL